jgi:methyl-accepting chemotaxis protein
MMNDKIKFGIFPKFLLFSLYISLIPLGVLTFTAYNDMMGLGDLLVREGKNSLEQFGIREIENRSKDVARQLEVYIRSHPEKTVQDLQMDSYFGELAVQPVGETGYTAVQDAHSAVNLFHKNPKIINMDLHQLADKLPAFWEIMEKSLGGQEASGFYDWKDPDGKVRKKFMYIAAVDATTADGVRMGVAATTYLDEFSRPMLQLASTVSGMIQKKLRFFYLVIALTVLFVISTSFFLARKITRPVLYLARITDQISIGKLGTRIEISSNDEIGVLINSIKRMQKSLVLAIKKLRERDRLPARHAGRTV